MNRTQAGFRSDRGTRDHIFNLQLIIQKCREMGKELRICFIDYSKAFDCVKHRELWNTLTEMGFGRRITSLIKGLYEGQESAVRLESGLTDWFPVQKGVRQGCILSPYLFSIYTEKIMRDVNWDVRYDMFDPIKVNGENIGDLRYADDTALLSHSVSGLDATIRTVKEYSEQKGLLLNARKTKIMDSVCCVTPSTIKVGDEYIERVGSFEYLGALLRNDGDFSKEIKRRLAIASRKLKELETLWSSADKSKAKISECVCFFGRSLWVRSMDV